ncbi:d-alanine-poly(phosphoribitol) ligase [Neisseria sp. HMSC15C08]|uniref:NMB0938 family lipoprotein n=1 Tax=Neisseria mucosa TaxID=488 RepID=UPI0008A34651|nr:d-alanine-poly(phosphoribitol) ligase [Neisseria mucosa]OFV35316.1 d-alanine-poly(phosphoribitol) ligase [Neisseria sp. HMSC15C08]
MIKNNTSQFFLLSLAVLLAACSPDKQDKVKESAASAPLSSVFEKSNTNDKTVEVDINKVKSAPSSNCANLHQIGGIDDFVRQVAENIDSSCLFERSPKELAAVWGIPGGDDPLTQAMFPDIDANDPENVNKVIEAIDQMTKGERSYNEQVIEPLVQEMKALRQRDTLVLSIGSHTSQGSNQPLRITRNFGIEATPEYLKKHGDGFGGSFKNISQLPEYLKSRGKIFEAQRAFRLFNRDRSPDKPYLEIVFDESGKIVLINVYENVSNPASGIHLM